eukprot:705070-Amorphochlora_amoeboformis.AAC.1
MALSFLLEEQLFHRYSASKISGSDTSMLQPEVEGERIELEASGAAESTELLGTAPDTEGLAFGQALRGFDCWQFRPEL